MIPPQVPLWDLPQQDEPEQQSPLSLVRRLLRGRYLVTIILAAVLGLGGAAAGFVFAKPEFESTATLRIAPVMPKVLYESEMSSPIPMFNSYVETQLSLIQSRRVIELAKQTPTWREAVEDTPEIADEFAQLLVTHPKGSQLILITALDENPAIAQASAKAVVDAYMEVYGETDLVKEMQRTQLLQERSAQFSRQLESLRRSILEIANEFGTDDLGEIHAFQVRELQTIESELKAAKLTLAIAESLGKDAKKNAAAVPELTVAEISAIDERMQHLVKEMEILDLKLQEIALVYKNPERRTDYQLAVQQQNFLQSKIDEHARTFRESYVANMGVMNSTTGAMSPILTPEQAKQKVERLQALYEETKAETLALGQKNLQIESLRAEMSRMQEALDKTNFRIEQLSVESSVGGRITILSQPELASEPVNAHKMRQMSLAGGVAGSGIALALVIFLGFLNPRVRYIADAEDVQPALLGALPELPEDVTDPADALIASQCVHQIRTVLQTNPRTRNAQVLTITSAASGTGKTSLALSLGLSFASSGTRTLIIDGDPVGRGLTRRTGVALRPKLARVLRESGVISEAQAKEALDKAKKSGKSIGQTLRDLGYIKKKELEDALTLQRECSAGLLHALNGEDPEDCTLEMGVPNLSILPASQWADVAIDMVSRRAMTELVDKLRNMYELILIDAGPVPGPTDSSIMAASADGVLMIVSRGEHNADLRRALHHLELIQAPLLGLVFNRANIRDLAHSNHSSSSSSARAYDVERTASQTEGFEHREVYARYGPLAQSVRSMSKRPPNQHELLNRNLLSGNN